MMSLVQHANSTAVKAKNLPLCLSDSLKTCRHTLSTQGRIPTYSRSARSYVKRTKLHSSSKPCVDVQNHESESPAIRCRLVRLPVEPRLSTFGTRSATSTSLPTCQQRQQHVPSLQHVRNAVSASARNLLMSMTAATLLVGAPAIAAESQRMLSEQESTVANTYTVPQSDVLRDMPAPLPGTEQSDVMAFVQHVSKSYDTLLQTRPLTTKIVTAIFCTIISDLLAQALTRTEGSKLDGLRTLRLVVFAIFFGTPICHYWFEFLDKVVFPTNPAAMDTVLMKVFVDQTLMAPFCTGLFFAGVKTLEGKPDKALDAVKSQLPGALKANYLLWPLANIINFAYIPLEYRTLYCNIVNIFWSAFLSMLANSKGGEQPQVDTPRPATGAQKRFTLAQLQAWAANVMPPAANFSAAQLALLAMFPLVLAGEVFPSPQEPMVKTIGQQLQTLQPTVMQVMHHPAAAPKLMYTSAPAAAVYKQQALPAVAPPLAADAFTSVKADSSCSPVAMAAPVPEAAVRQEYICASAVSNKDTAVTPKATTAIVPVDGKASGHSA